MSKISLKAHILSDIDDITIKTVGIKQNNKIIYKENDINVTIVIQNNRIEMKRVCKFYEINLIFEKDKLTKSTYQFDSSKILDLQTLTKKLIIKDNLIKIDYELEGNKFSYSLNMGG